MRSLWAHRLLINRKHTQTQMQLQNAAISARLPYTMASSRIAQYLKVMGRDRVGSNIEAGNIEKELTDWIQQYVNPECDW